MQSRHDMKNNFAGYWRGAVLGAERMERFDADVVVVGAGVVGLAIAASLAAKGRSVTILEKNAGIGMETSSRNSEVVHAGLYYGEGSLKGRFCVEGRDLLYERAEKAGFAANRIGKLIVATAPEEVAALEGIQKAAAANGVHELEMIGGETARAWEPALNAVAALWSPLTGVIDSHALMESYLGEAEDHGAMLALEAPFLRAERAAPGGDARWSIDTGGAAPAILDARLLIVAAGLWSPQLTRRIEGLAADARPDPVFYKGNYFRLSSGRAPFSRLIYPAPVPGGLGVHLTLDVGGGAKFGPDVEPLEVTDAAELDYSVDAARGEAFYGAIRRYWPGLPDGVLVPDYSGVRPKVAHDYGTDFRIDGPAEHGAEGLIALYGFESPALTGSLAIGRHVAGMVEQLDA